MSSQWVETAMRLVDSLTSYAFLFARNPNDRTERHFEDARKALEAHLNTALGDEAKRGSETAACLPRGWVAVPVEPTKEMLDAGYAVIEDTRGVIKAGYRAMLAAAPSVSGDKS